GAGTMRSRARVDDRAAIAAMSQAACSPHEVSALAHLPKAIAARSAVGYVNGAGRAVTAVRVEGPAPSVAHRAEALRRLWGGKGNVEELHAHNSNTLWREVGNVASLLPDADAVIWKLSVTPSMGSEVMAAALVTGGAGYYDWAGGLLWLALPVGNDSGDGGGDGGAGLVRASLGGDGHATLMRGGVELRRRVDVFQPTAAPLAALSARIKASFDPHGILNPGRMHGAY
ncbi:MAG: 2-hydroxy-acid oxidase, partial [Alphaproteobacteria bacterium]|nr:2-hydroxy-acid oxidase [Alphaproteobacteria bacterium]